MNDTYRDPATGRPYVIDEQGMPRWADEQAPAPEPEPFARVASQPAHSRAAAAPAKRRGILLPVLAAAATGLVGLAVGYGIGAAGTGVGSTPTSTSRATAEAAASVPDDGPGTAQPEPPTVSVSNYTAELKTLSKQCFGSAGCSLELRVELGVDSAVRDVDAEVIVTITGDESGPITQTMEVQGGQYSPAEVSLSTPSSKTKISVKVTSAEAL